MIDAKDSNSTRPYLIRALYEWCTDNGFTPFIAVLVDESVRVPLEYVRDGAIVLNISFDATSALKLENDYIEFKGRFGGVARDILVPVDHVLAIYARENGEGMAFPLLASSAVASVPASELPSKGAKPVEASPSEVQPPEGPKPAGGGRSALTRIK